MFGSVPLIPLTLIFLIFAIHSTGALKCHQCVTRASQDPCKSKQMDPPTECSNGETSCFTNIVTIDKVFIQDPPAEHTKGEILTRGCQTNKHEKECVEGSSFKSCFCTTDGCNNGTGKRSPSFFLLAASIAFLLFPFKSAGSVLTSRA